MRSELPPKKNQRLYRSFACALAGIGTAILRERNLRIHISFAILALYLAALYRLNRTEWAILTLVIGLVITCELINTAIEHLVDQICPGDKPNPLAGAVKDIAAGAVLVSAGVSTVVGLLLFTRPEPAAAAVAYLLANPLGPGVVLAGLVLFIYLPSGRR